MKSIDFAIVSLVGGNSLTQTTYMIFTYQCLDDLAMDYSAYSELNDDLIQGPDSTTGFQWFDGMDDTGLGPPSWVSLSIKIVSSHRLVEHRKRISLELRRTYRTEPCNPDLWLRKWVQPASIRTRLSAFSRPGNYRGATK